MRFCVRNLIGAQLVNDFLNLIARDQRRLRQRAFRCCTVSHFQTRHAFLIRRRNSERLKRRILLEILLTSHQIDHHILYHIRRNFRVAARYMIAVLQCIVNRVRMRTVSFFRFAIVCNRQFGQLMNLLDALGIGQLILVNVLNVIIPVNVIIRAFNRCRCNIIYIRDIIVITKDIVLDADYHNNGQNRQYNHLLPVVQECLKVKIIDDLNNHVTQNHTKDQTKPHATRRAGKDYSEDQAKSQAREYAHKPLDRCLRASERNSHARILALAAYKQEVAQHAQHDGQNNRVNQNSHAAHNIQRCIKQRHIHRVRIMKGYEIIAHRAAVQDKGLHQRNGRAKGLIEHCLIALYHNHQHRNTQLCPNAQQNGDDGVTGQHRAQDCNRVIEQEIRNVAQNTLYQ